MPVVGEWMTPWIAASFLVSACAVAFVVGGREIPTFEKTLLGISLCATLTAATLVRFRAIRTQQMRAREERARPPVEALDGSASVCSPAYVDGMQRWTTAVLELLEHAHGCAAQGTELAADLGAALADTRDLEQLLAASDGDLDINEAATIHALCTLWETNQPRIEKLAAQSDPGWHRRWAARVVADRRLRHGGAPIEPMEIPYRT